MPRRRNTRPQDRQGQLGQTHMDNLRDVERHDQDMARGHVNHSRDHAHAMDRHGADMTIMGIEANRAGEQHDLTMEQMAQPESRRASSNKSGAAALGIYHGRPRGGFFHE
jgi:hypothetical protein